MLLLRLFMLSMVFLLEHGITEIPDLRPARDAEPGEEGRKLYIGATSRSSETMTTRVNSSSARLVTPSTLSSAATASTGSAVTQSRAIIPEEQTMSESWRRLSLSVNRSEDSELKLLLDRVVRAAEESQLPPHETFASHTPDPTNSAAATANLVIFGVRLKDAMAHDMKIGAAGELYVCR